MNTGSAEKYDMSVCELNEETSQGKILAQIAPGSTVLECGCATGYMTRWMSERLHCAVSIVEIDPHGYKQALPYAADGYCGDLSADPWQEHYRENRFDYILFADVLEHLADPLQVLKKAEALLKDDGKILVSIPNIAHNDILIKLFENRFDYTPTGLLDNTHIHFWGRNNIGEFCAAAGLAVVRTDGIIRKTGYTEQLSGAGSVRETDEDLICALSRRDGGEVYQYILTLQKKACAEACGIRASDLLHGNASGLAAQAGSILRKREERAESRVEEIRREGDRMAASFEDRINELLRETGERETRLNDRLREKVQEAAEAEKACGELQVQTAEREKEYRELLEQYSRLKQEYEQIRSSLSWKITAPVRKLLGAFRKRIA